MFFSLKKKKNSKKKSKKERKGGGPQKGSGAGTLNMYICLHGPSVKTLALHPYECSASSQVEICHVSLRSILTLVSSEDMMTSHAFLMNV